MVWYSFQFQAGQIALLERGLRWCWYGVVPGTRVGYASHAGEIELAWSQKYNGD